MMEKQDNTSEQNKKKKRMLPLKKNYSPSYIQSFTYEGICYEFDEDSPEEFIRKKRQILQQYHMKYRQKKKKARLEKAKEQGLNHQEGEVSLKLEESCQEYSLVQKGGRQKFSDNLNQELSLLEEKRGSLLVEIEHKLKEKSGQKLTGKGYEHQHSTNVELGELLLTLFGNHDKLEGDVEKKQLGQGRLIAVEEAVNRVKEVEPDVDEEHLKNTLQQIRDIESQIREKRKEVECSGSAEVECPGSSEVEASIEKKQKIYRPFRLEGVRYVYEENPQEYLKKKLILKRMEMRRSNEKKYEKRELQFALKEVKWRSSKKDIIHLAEEEEIKNKIKSQHQEYEAVKSRKIQLEKSCRKLAEECKRMMKVLKEKASKESKSIQSENEQQSKKAEAHPVSKGNKKKCYSPRYFQSFTYQGVRYDYEEDPERFLATKVRVNNLRKQASRQRISLQKDKQKGVQLSQPQQQPSECLSLSEAAQNPTNKLDVISQLRSFHEEREEEIKQFALYIHNLEEEQKRIQTKKQKLLVELSESPNPKQPELQEVVNLKKYEEPAALGTRIKRILLKKSNHGGQHSAPSNDSSLYDSADVI